MGFQNQLPAQQIIYLSLVARLIGTATELLMNGVGFIYLSVTKPKNPKK
jgi:hypothetical protein